MIARARWSALAVSTPQRAPALPNVPTTAEAGYPEAAYLFWGGLFAPENATRSRQQLHDEAVKALKVPAVQERLVESSASSRCR